MKDNFLIKYMSEKSRTKISKAKSKNILGSWTQFMWEGHDSQHFVVKVLFAEYVNVLLNQQKKGPKYKRAKSEQNRSKNIALLCKTGTDQPTAGEQAVRTLVLS